MKPIPMFEALDGTIHAVPADALKADLVHLLKLSAAINDASAMELAGYIIKQDDYRMSLITTLKGLTP